MPLQLGVKPLLFLCLKPIIRSMLKPLKSLGEVNFYSPLLACGFSEKLPYFAPLGFNWVLWRVSANWDRRPGQFTLSTNLYFPSVGCRYVRPVRQLGVNLPKTAGQKHKKCPRFQVEIGGISFHLFPQVAGGFAFLPYAATLCGAQRMEIRRFKITFRLLPHKILILHRHQAE